MRNPWDARRVGPISFILTAAVLLGPGNARGQVFLDGFESGDTSAWSQVVGAVPVVFRFSDLDLRDPHLFAPAGILGCFDFTDDPIPVVDFSFNGSLQDQITGDADGDDFLDLTSLLLFRLFYLQSTGQPVDFDDGMCLAPIEDTVCGPDPTTPAVMTSYDSLDAGACLGTVPGTTSGFLPAVGEPLAPCFVTVAETIPFQLGDLAVTLEDVQIAANFANPRATTLDTGLIRGFLSEADADALLLPADLPIVGGQPLSVLLPGGVGSCAPGDDRDIHEAVSGWWFYFNFTAEQVTFIEG